MVETVHPKARAWVSSSIRSSSTSIKNWAYRSALKPTIGPRLPGDEPELMEEYSYMNLRRLNVGLKDRDFDHNNRQYSYGRL